MSASSPSFGRTGPHYDELQRLLESFWIPDFTSTEQLLLQFDLIIVPDPVLAKYLVESYYEKEAKVDKKKQYYAKLIKQPFGVLDAFPPKERYEYERIKNLSKQKWIRKFPPIATCGNNYLPTCPYTHTIYLLYLWHTD